MKPASPLVTDETLHIARAVAALGDRIAMDGARLPPPRSVPHPGIGRRVTGDPSLPGRKDGEGTSA
jgi:hypothetical protein